MVRFVYVHLRSIAEEIYVAKQFCSRLSTENAEVADSELIDENGAQPSSSELDGWKKIGKGEPGYKNETPPVIVTVIASMLLQNHPFLMRRDVVEFVNKRWPSGLAWATCGG